jgi:hypothetical protein
MAVALSDLCAARGFDGLGAQFMLRFQSISSHVALRPSAQNQEFRPLSDEGGQQNSEAVFPPNGLHFF